VINRTRVHAVGIDRAVNAGFLGRLAARGAGRCELVESEDRLDEAMTHIQRRIGAPVITDVVVTPESVPPTAIYPGVPLVVFGRYSGSAPESMTVRGRTRDGADWQEVVSVRQLSEPAVRAQWARAALRDLEDRYATGDRTLEAEIVRTSLRFGVLCRFTAFVAVDEQVVSDGTVHRVVQPVEHPAGWELPAPPMAAPMVGFAPAPGRFGAAPDGLALPSAPAAFAPPPAPQAAAGRFRSRLPSSAPKPMAGGGAVMDDSAELREIAALEVQRLEKDAARPAWEREELLADLVSRLGTLVADRQGPAYEPLRRLVAELTAGGNVDELWARAVQVLREFAGQVVAKDRRRSFWR
jgi:Ca-activated chloride channel family protein